MKYGTNTVSECPINMLSEFSLPDTLSSPLSIFCTYEMHKYTELLKYCSKIDENLTMNKHFLFCNMIALTCSRRVVGEKRFYLSCAPNLTGVTASTLLWLNSNYSQPLKFSPVRL